MFSTKARVGVFLLAGIALFALGLFLIGSRERVFNRGFHVYADFSSAGGLVTGAEVRVSGLNAGELLEIQVPNRPSGQYRLKMRLENSVRPLIREDSMAAIQTDGLVGDKFLEIAKGSDDSPECPTDCTLPTSEPFDLSDLVQNSRQLLDTANNTLEGFGEVADNVNRTFSEFMTKNREGKSGPDELKATVASTQRAMTNLAADTEALQHNFFLRGFFHRRGYYNLSGMTPAEYRTSKFAKAKDVKRVWLPADELFAKGGKGPETLSAQGKGELDRAMDNFVSYLPNRPLIVEGYSSDGPPDEEYLRSQQRAATVEQYLEARFRLDPSLVGGIPLENSPPEASGKTAWDGISLVVLP